MIRDLEYADSLRCVSFYDMFLNLVSFFDVTTLIDHERFLHVSRDGLIEFYSSDIGATGCIFLCEKCELYRSGDEYILKKKVGLILLPYLYSRASAPDGTFNFTVTLSSGM